MVRAVRMRLCAMLVLPLAGSPARLAQGDPAAEQAPSVVLKSGHVLAGKVAESLTVEGTPMYRVETDFGEVLVPRASTSRKEAGAPVAKDATFFARHVRVVQVSGDVQRRPTADAPWEKVTLTDPYATEPKLNAPNAVVAPGDTLRTGSDGQIDLMLHRSVWVRVSPNSEVEIPRQRAGASLSLLRGDVVQKVEGQPRGEIYRVRTPTTLLGIRGTLFAVHAREAEHVDVAEGAVAVGSDVLVAAGQRALRSADGTWQVQALADEGQRLRDIHIVRFPLDRMALLPTATYSLGGYGEVDSRPEDQPYPTSVPCDMSWTLEFKLEVQAFLMDRTEVTRATLDAWRRATGADAPSITPGATVPPAPEGGAMPVEGIPWTQARALARWLGKDLPTDAQWEAAARGPEGRVWPWGNKLGKQHLALPIYLVPPGVTWQPGHSKVPSTEAATVDVSPLGIQGMCSDPPEWTRSLYADDVYMPHLRDPELQPRIDAPGLRSIRGCLGTTRTRLPNRPENPGAGLRCVVELAPKR